MTFARNLLARIARAIGVSTDTRAAYVAPVEMITRDILATTAEQSGGAYGDSSRRFLAMINGKRVWTNTRADMVALLAINGLIAR